MRNHSNKLTATVGFSIDKNSQYEAQKQSGQLFDRQ